MRKIKFRGKRIDYNWFVYGHYYYSLDDDAHVITDTIHHKDFVCNNMSEPAHDEQMNYHVRPDTVGQFTGLYDKNGKEIYEGDIINIGVNDSGFTKNDKGETVKYEVRFGGCDYILYRTDLNLYWGRLSRLEEMNWHCKVINNIHDTPELLGATNDNK